MAKRVDPERSAFGESWLRDEILDLTVAELCGQAGVSTASFFVWQRRLPSGSPRPFEHDQITVAFAAGAGANCPGSR